MKKGLLYLFVLICSTAMFTSCNNDEKEIFPVDEELVGTYKGAMDIVLDKLPIAAQLPKNVNISKAGDNQIKMELKDFVFGGMNIGTITIDRCDLVRSGDVYSFTGSQTLTLLDPIGTCPVTVKGTIGKGNLKMNIDVDVKALNQSVQVDYSGVKLSGSEKTEAKITAFTIDNALVLEQPVINEEQGTITFKVNETATADDLKAMAPTLTISEKAVVNPASGVAQDFSNGKKVTYTVVAENGTVKEYVASIAGNLNVLSLPFEEWTSVGEGPAMHDEPLPKDLLASSVEGAALLFLYGVEGFPVYKTNDKVAGESAIKLVTMDTSAAANSLVPALVSGSVFTGKFDLKYAFSDKLLCTRFGVPYTKKPVRFKGWYKYTPGEKFIDGTDYKDIKVIAGKKDECSIQAVLYKVTKDDEVLTGHDLNSSDKRVAVAVLQDGTAKANYTEFDIPFTLLDGKSYEAGAKYKMAIVCSSSKEGDFFKGAGGSTLILDELEVIGE
ncbi:PCMD domain-containing protein [Bacteroides sp.]|uniref:PCMD domain-containing protein n=1 Tax=Bacteroides sp. TaxID=29523 RepID=UPI002FC9E8CA